MPLYLRKGINLGPVRLNLSKGGVGVSVGGKGLRAGIDAQGRATTSAGRYGLYYRDQQGGITLKWVLILLLGLGVWFAQSQGWFAPAPKPRAHHAHHRAHATGSEESYGEPMAPGSAAE